MSENGNGMATARTAGTPEERVLALEEQRLAVQREELSVRRLEAEAAKMTAQANLREAMGALTPEERALERERARLDLERARMKMRHEMAELVADSGFLRESIKPEQRYAFSFGLVAMSEELNLPPFSMAQNAYCVHGAMGFEVDYMAAVVSTRAELDEPFTYEFGPTDPRKNQGLPDFVIARCKLRGERVHREYRFTADMVLSASWSKEKSGDLKGAYRSEGANQMRRRAVSRLISSTPALKAILLGMRDLEEGGEDAIRVEVIQHGKQGPALPPAPPTPQLEATALPELLELFSAATASQREAAQFIVGADEQVPVEALPPSQQAQLLVELKKLNVQRRAAPPVPAAVDVVAEPVPAQQAAVAAPAVGAAPMSGPTVEDVQALETSVGAEVTQSARRRCRLSANANLARLPETDRLLYAQALEQEIPPDERRWSAAR